jgi:hypothetical protein
VLFTHLFHDPRVVGPRAAVSFQDPEPAADVALAKEAQALIEAAGGGVGFGRLGLRVCAFCF